MLFLCEYGIARKNIFPEGSKYEHRHIGTHHDHIICTRCGKVVEFFNAELENFQKTISQNHGFTLFRHVMDMYGICDKCKDENDKVVSFSTLPSGVTIIVTHIEGGKGAVQHLSDLGISVGKSLTLIKKDPFVLVSVGDSRFALGQGLVEKIYGVPE